jgi:predicted aspartyl protease
MVGAVLGITAEAAQNLAVVIAVALVLLAALFAKVLIGNLAKIVAAVLLVAAAVFVWTQRASLQDCADQVKAEAQANAAGTAECTVSGLTFSVDLDR